MAATRDCQKEDNDPRNANLRPHLQVNRTNTGVQASTHEHVVDKIAGHANLVTSCDGKEIYPKGDCETVDHCNRHDMTIVADDFCEPENVVVVQQGSSDHRDVDGPESIAVVHQCLVTKRRDRQSFLLVTRHDPSEEELIDDETGIDLPGIGIRAGILSRCNEQPSVSEASKGLTSRT